MSPECLPKYRVVVLAAGKGRRLGKKTEEVHKALLPLGFKPILSHILEKFPAEVEVVVAVGHKKEMIRDYLAVAHPERRFTFVEVENFDGPGSGPGLSLLACKQFLMDDPFLLTTVDTLVQEAVPPPEHDWLGIAPVASTKRFNSVAFAGGCVANMRDKEECANRHAFIGLCGIKNTSLFWKNLEANPELIGGELQLSNGLRALVETGEMRGIPFTWFDTGDDENFRKAVAVLTPEHDEKFDFSKRDEFIYFVNGKVVKYFRDKKIAEQRARRATILSGLVPTILREKNNFYAYEKAPGEVLYPLLTRRLLEELLDWLNANLWKRASLDGAGRSNFRDLCRKFYYEKTYERCELYFASTRQEDGRFAVNGKDIPSLADLLSRVPWESLYDGVAGQFHGDLQFDNILVTPQSSTRFLLIDWRQNFGGCVEYGDIYYDLAKIYGGILLPYDRIKKGHFSCAQEGREVRFSVATRPSLVEARPLFCDRVGRMGFDVEKIKLLTAIIFLNMAPLHEYPFNILLHHLGKQELMLSLNGLPNDFPWLKLD